MQLQKIFGKIHRMWLTAMLLAVFMAGCEAGQPAPDFTVPAVTSTTPANADTGVALNTQISATFSEPMDPSTITAATFTLTQGSTPVAGIVAYSGTTATFAPAANLAVNTNYTVRITTGARDLDETHLAKDYVCSFTTGATTDTTAPTVSSTTPANAAVGVVLNTGVNATFSEAMDPATITAANFILKQGATPVTGTVTYNGATATFSPANNLAANTVFTATMKTGARDLAGNALVSDYVWSFTTGATTNNIPPTVTSTIPANAAIGVALNQGISANFSAAIAPATITNATFTLQQGTTPVAGTVTGTGATATFIPAVNLAANTTYTATITTGIKDNEDNALENDYVWRFTTGVAPDVIAPVLISTDPGDADNGVALNREIHATFSEAMSPATINTATFTLTGPSGVTPVTGTVTYDAPSRIATFTPASSLALNGTYTATISSGARDLAGNALANGAVPNPWSFTTTASPQPTSQAKLSFDAADGFAVLAGTTVSNSGLSTVNGDLGVNPGNTVTGFPPGTVIGTIHPADPAAALARHDLSNAFNDAAGRTTGVVVVANGELGGLTLPPGLYNSGSSSFKLTSGDLILDAQGDPQAVFIFQVPSSSLNVGDGLRVILNGAKDSRIFWQVGGSATLGANSVFKGSILAAGSITLQSGATLDGRALTRDGAVTLDANAITAPSP